MKTHRTPLFVALVALLGASTACEPLESSQTGDDAVTRQAEPLTERDGPARKGRGPHAHRGGPDMIFDVALRELDLSDEQRSRIEATQRDLRVSPSEQDRDAMEEHRSALAAAIRKGEIDADRLAPRDRKRGGRAKMAAALQSLHETLTAEQRASLVATLEERMAERPEGPRRGDRARAPRDPSRMLLRGIDVSDEQRASIDAALAKAGEGSADPAERMESMRAHQQAVLDAFAKASFDASALPERPAGHEGRFTALAVIVPLLDADQREALAQRIEQGPPRHGKRGRHMKRHMKGAPRR